ncbi:MAG: hypothetical protein ACM3Q4_02670 [Acidobacteriota bacterium]
MLMELNNLNGANETALHAKSVNELTALSNQGQWQELVRISKDVIQSLQIKEAAAEHAVACLKQIADTQYRAVEKNKRNSTECSNRLLSLITNKTVQSLSGRNEVIEYLGERMIDICTMDFECYYNLINIANNTDIRSNINLKALAAYYDVMFDEEGKVRPECRKEIEHAVRYLNIRYVNMSMMTYALGEKESEKVYLLVNYIESKRG